MKLKEHGKRYTELLEAIYPLLGFEVGADFKRCLIVIDGRVGSGKTHLANWLGWQLGQPTLHADLYTQIGFDDLIDARYEDIKLTIAARLNRQRAIILEGVFCLDILEKIGEKPDFLIYVRKGRALRDCDRSKLSQKYFTRHWDQLRKPNFSILSHNPN